MVISARSELCVTFAKPVILLGKCNETSVKLVFAISLAAWRNASQRALINGNSS